MALPDRILVRLQWSLPSAPLMCIWKRPDLLLA